MNNLLVHGFSSFPPVLLYGIFIFLAIDFLLRLFKQGRELYYPFRGRKRTELKEIIGDCADKDVLRNFFCNELDKENFRLISGIRREKNFIYEYIRFFYSLCGEIEFSFFNRSHPYFRFKDGKLSIDIKLNVREKIFHLMSCVTVVFSLLSFASFLFAAIFTEPRGMLLFVSLLSYIFALCFLLYRVQPYLMAKRLKPKLDAFYADSISKDISPPG